MKFRSVCPLARSLDMIGDKWTLLVLREVAAFGKTTYKELAQMKEGIATNTLADRLEKLVSEDFLTKTKSDKNKLVYHYHITEKGLDLLPVIQSLIAFSEKYLYKDSEREELQQLMATSKFS